MNLLNKKPVFFAAIAALFLALLLGVFRDFAFDSSTLMLNSDQLNGIGSRILRAQDVILTEWDDSRLGGVPTIDALFADAYHPLVWVQFLTDPARAVGFKFILTIWVAFMSAMLLAWNLTGSKWWGTLLGFLYAFSPSYFTYVYGGHDGKMMVFAIAPLALLAIRKIVRDGSIPYMIVLALSIVWMILGSHLQLTYLFLWGAGLYTLYEVAFHCDGLKTRGKRLGFAAIGLAFGLAISCFQVIPPYMYTTTQSVRGDSSHTNYGHAASWSLHQPELMQMLIPGYVGVDVYTQDPKTNDLQGSSLVDVSMDEYQAMAQAGSQGSPFYWGNNAFKLDHNNAGALLTFLGFLCLFLPGKRRWACFWGLGAVVALSYGMGLHSPLFKLWYAILPGVKNFRAPGMALFWQPLLLIMMAAPVVRAFSNSDENTTKNHRALLHGTAMYVIMLILVLASRFCIGTFMGPVGFVVVLAFAVACLGIMSLDDQEKPFTVNNFINAFTNKLPGTPRGIQACIIIGFALVGTFLLSGQKLLEDPIAVSYFKPFNEIVMTATAGKIILSFVVVLIVIGAAWFVFKSKNSVPVKVAILMAIAGFELYTINGAFVQNVPAKQYLQPDNYIVKTIKDEHKADSLNMPRVLSLSGNPALGANAFPQYNLRNAAGIHDNELASYRLFRGDQQNANYMLNLVDPFAPHPFLDLMNIAYIIFDTRKGPTYFPNTTAMGEAYIYGNAVVMSDEDAIAALQHGDVREIKAESTPVTADSANVATASAADSTTIDSTSADAEVAKSNDNGFEAALAELENPNAKKSDPNAFYYKETVILSEAPANLKGGIAQGSARLVESPKMDTQVFQVESDRPAIMVVAGNYHPFWKATVNGAPAKVYKAFGTLRAVEVPMGKSTVRMEYRSNTFHSCIKFSLMAAVLLIIIGIVAAIKAHRKK